MHPFIKRPNRHRSTFAIIGPDGKTIKDPRIDKANKDLRAGTAIDLIEARIRATFEALFPKNGLSLLSISNEKLIHELHAYKVAEKPNLSSPDKLLNRLLWAIAEIGPISLREASREELLGALQRIKKPARRHEVARAINECLKYANRPFTLKNPRILLRGETLHISPEQFCKNVSQLPLLYQLYLGALFATGCRWGELPRALVREIDVQIFDQVKKDGSVGPTKNRIERVALLLPPMEKWAKEFYALPQSVKNDLRLNHYNKMYAICKKVFGIHLHALRHSYCIALLKGGDYNKYEIAEWIGDTPEMVFKRYGRYFRTAPEMMRFRQRWAG